MVWPPSAAMRNSKCEMGNGDVDSFWLVACNFQFSILNLWVGSDRDNSDGGNSSLNAARIRTVVPENAVSARCIVLGIGLKNLGAVRCGQR